MGVVEDVQAHLANQNIVDDGTWTSVRRRVHDDSGDRIVVLTEDGGAAPETSRASGIGDSAIKRPAVQIMVRGRPWNGDESQSKAQAIYDELHGKNSTTLNSVDYISVRAQTAEPIFVGFDDNGRPMHTISFVLRTDA